MNALSDTPRPSRAPKERIVVVDRRRLVREGVATLLAAQLGRSVESAGGVAGLPGFGGGTIVVLGELGDHNGSISVPEAQIMRLQATSDIAALAREVSKVLSTASGAARRSGATARLTARERLILGGVSNGHSAAQIARELGISVRTVERHKHSVMAKLDAPNQARAVALALELRLLDPGLDDAV